MGGAVMSGYVRIELPGGYVRVVKEATYNTLVINLRAMARSLENAEFVSEPNGETRLALKGGRAWWRGLFVAADPTLRKVQ
jgi:hypothetical protein